MLTPIEDEIIRIRLAIRKARAQFGCLLLRNGHLLEGFAENDQRFSGRPEDPAHQPRWQGQQLNGEAVFVMGEGADGDHFFLMRYVPLIKQCGGCPVLAVQQPLAGLSRTLGVDVVTPFDCVLPRRYYHIKLGSLPVVFQTTLETIPQNVPFFRGDPSGWRDVLADMPGLKVGLCWAGRVYTPGVMPPETLMALRAKSAPLSTFVPLLEVPGCSFVALQKGPAVAELRDEKRVRDVPHRLRDWTDTADLICGLDLVISVDTGVCHVAGGLGRPVWTVLHEPACWRWLEDRSDSPWYSSMRLFRQPAPDDWTSVIGEVAVQLAERAERAP